MAYDYANSPVAVGVAYAIGRLTGGGGGGETLAAFAAPVQVAPIIADATDNDTDRVETGSIAHFVSFQPQNVSFTVRLLLPPGLAEGLSVGILNNTNLGIYARNSEGVTKQIGGNVTVKPMDTIASGLLRCEIVPDTGDLRITQDNIYRGGCTKAAYLAINSDLAATTRTGARLQGSAQFTDIIVSAYSVYYPPLTLGRLYVDPATKLLTGPLSYYSAEETAIEAQFEDLNGSVLTPWTAITVTSNPADGTAKVASAVPAPVSKKGRSFVAKLRTRKTQKYVRSKPVIYSNPVIFTQNVAGLFDANRPMRTSSNMLAQSYWQTASPVNGSYDKTYVRGEAGHLDAEGYPLSGDKYLWYPLPDQQKKQVTVEMQWTGGNADFRHFGGGIGAGIVECGNMVTTVEGGKQTRRWTMTIDREQASNGYSGRLQLYTLDTANPPKNITMRVIEDGVGDDLTKPFLPSFINFLKQLPDGPLRFMDDFGVNGERVFVGATWNWAARPTPTGIARGMTPEDLVYICNAANRPLWWNIHPSFAYETGGLDYYDRLTDYFIANIVRMIFAEVGNEQWNGDFGGYGCYHYYRLITTETTGTTNDKIVAERNKAQTLLMGRLESRVPNWRQRVYRVLNLQMGDSDFSNVTNNSYWKDGTDQHVDGIARAPYIPNDPAAGGGAPKFTDKTPAGIFTYQVNQIEADIGPKLELSVLDTLSIGLDHLVYEFNESIPALELTYEQSKAWRASPLHKKLWAEHIIPWLSRTGGGVTALYSDVANIRASSVQSWGTWHIPGAIYNGAWDACADYETARKLTAG